MKVLFKSNPITSAIALTTLAAYVLFTMYVLSEPSIANGQASDSGQIVVTQEITGEIALTIASTSIRMDGAIAGVTGGSSTGTTSANVISNNATGYNLTIDFEDSVAMQQDAGAGFIDNYNPSTGGGNGDYNMSVGAGEAAFAYTVSGIVADIEDRFKNDGAGDCTGTTNSDEGFCWYNVGTGDATSAVTLVDRSTATASTGATTTINFQVRVGSGSSLEEGFYTATSTITATENL